MAGGHVRAACTICVGIRGAIQFETALAQTRSIAQISSVPSYAQYAPEASRDGNDEKFASGRALFAASAGEFCSCREFVGFGVIRFEVRTLFSRILEEKEIEQEVPPLSSRTDAKGPHARPHL
jgi:hypothetical protein